MPFQDLAERLAVVRARIDSAVARGGFGQRVTLVAVTKGHRVEAVRAAWEAGVSDIGENRVQEALVKMDEVDVPVRWHLIGHLQRNKAKHVGRFRMLHSLDSPRLADAVGEVAERLGRRLEVLVQVNVSGEATKSGYAAADVEREAERLRGANGLVVRGAMTMAPYGADERTLRRVFQGARAARDALARAGHPATELSMGMSDDYEIAVEEGATMVRLGTTLFGARDT